MRNETKAQRVSINPGSFSFLCDVYSLRRRSEDLAAVLVAHGHCPHSGSRLQHPMTGVGPGEAADTACDIHTIRPTLLTVAPRPNTNHLLKNATAASSNSNRGPKACLPPGEDFHTGNQQQVARILRFFMLANHRSVFQRAPPLPAAFPAQRFRAENIFRISSVIYMSQVQECGDLLSRRSSLQTKDSRDGITSAAIHLAVSLKDDSSSSSSSSFYLYAQERFPSKMSYCWPNVTVPDHALGSGGKLGETTGTLASPTALLPCGSGQAGDRSPSPQIIIAPVDGPFNCIVGGRSDAPL
ncbi:hypothetical protein CCH79_00008598 [Gambusia affinis]|uniref:Uncharacterized protein n=1 Tax=Gambusia affinis TaxID=33528 RepID=A0A315UYV9_GAMAF|nr:hypothetical protein CCH79_00008598 [Gambusia affinis]